MTPEQLRFVELAQSLQPDMREGRRLQWVDHPERAAATVHLFHLSKLPLAQFARSAHVSATVLTAFINGETTTYRNWPELEAKLKKDPVEFLENFFGGPLDEVEIGAWPELDELAAEVGELRKKHKRISWTQHPDILDKIRELSEQIEARNYSQTAFFTALGIHHGTLERYLGMDKQPRRKVKSKKSAKKKTSNAKKSTKAPKKEQVVISIDVEDIRGMFRLQDGILIGDCRLHLEPDTDAYQAIIKHALAKLNS